jgi:hypothetical protein
MPEWIRWTDIFLLVVVALAFTIAMKRCMHAQRTMKIQLTKQTKASHSGVDGSPGKLA